MSMADGRRPAVKKVAFTMYPVSDVTRARFAITNTTGDAPSAGAGGTIALEVDDLTGLIEHLRSAGVTFKSDVIRGPRCRMAVCLDPEGNSLLLHELDRASEA